jgi:hypothetical protein
MPLSPISEWTRVAPILAILVNVLAGCASWQEGTSSGTASSARGTDEAEIREYIKKGEAETPFVKEAPDLDWENAFGIRYNNLTKRDAFYREAVAPLQVGDTGGTLEVKVRFVGPSLAVADEYWHEVGQRDVDTLKRGPDRWGRTTYILQKADGKWTEIIERVADLRLAYYRHYEALPASVPLSDGAMAKLGGTFRFHRATLTLDRAADRFIVTRRLIANPEERSTLVGIPTSASTVLIFDPSDLAEYSIMEYSEGIPTITRSGDDPAIAGTRGTRISQ